MTSRSNKLSLIEVENNNLEQSPRSGMVAVGFMGLASFLAFGMQAPILSLFIVDLGATVGILSMILSARGFVEIFLRIPFASASDKVGRKYLCFLGLACFTITPLILVIAGIFETWTLVIFSMVIQSVGISALWPAIIAHAATLYPKERSGESMGRLFRMADLGQILGPIITGFLVSSLNLNYTQVFLVSFLSSLLLSFFSLSLFKETSDVRISAKESINIFLYEFLEGFRKMKTPILNRDTLGPNLAIFFFGAVISSTIMFFPLLGRDRDLIEAEIGSAMSARWTIPWFFKVRLGMISDVYGRSYSVVLSLLALALLLIAMSLTHSFVLLLILLACIGLFQAVVMPAINGAIIDVVPETERGIYVGTWGAFFSAGRAVSLLIFGVVATYFGIDASFVAAGVWVALGALFYIIARPPAAEVTTAESLESILVFKEGV